MPLNLIFEALFQGIDLIVRVQQNQEVTPEQLEAYLHARNAVREELVRQAQSKGTDNDPGLPPEGGL
jgi:hypothetical protein